MRIRVGIVVRYKSCLRLLDNRDGGWQVSWRGTLEDSRVAMSNYGRFTFSTTCLLAIGVLGVTIGCDSAGPESSSTDSSVLPVQAEEGGLPQLAGQVSVSSDPRQGRSFVEANFVEGATVYTLQCRKESIDGCTFERCDSELLSPPPRPPKDLGLIEITSESRRMILSPQPDGSYSSAYAPFPLWTRPGEKVRMEYTLNGKKLSIEQTAPAYIVLDPIAFSAKRRDPLSVSWTGVSPDDGGVVEVNIARWSTSPRITLRCTASPNRGHLVFLPSMLARLEPGRYDVVAFSSSRAFDALGASLYLDAVLPSQGSGILVQ